MYLKFVDLKEKEANPGISSFALVNFCIAFVRTFCVLVLIT